MKNKDLLKNWVICCHVDKPLAEEEPVSIFDCKIQAGAALTEKRICEYNDHDNFPESISARNQRYSEATAMYWISKHIDSEYVGIAHYRRRFDITDSMINTYLNDGIDLITSIPHQTSLPYGEGYKDYFLFAADWKLFLNIFNQIHPKDYWIVKKLSSQTSIHPCNMNIFKSSLFDTLSSWMFPVLDEFWKDSPEKTDVYLKRDVGFIAEFLSNVYVEKLIHEGKKFVEVPIIQLKSSASDNYDKFDKNDIVSLYNACNKLYVNNYILRSCSLLFTTIEDEHIDLSNDKISDLVEIFALQAKERKYLPKTMFEYLPSAYRKDLDSVKTVYSASIKFIIVYLSNPCEENLVKLQRFISLTGFSKIIVEDILDRCTGISTDKNIVLTKLYS